MPLTGETDRKTEGDRERERESGFQDMTWRGRTAETGREQGWSFLPSLWVGITPHEHFSQTV